MPGLGVSFPQGRGVVPLIIQFLNWGNFRIPHASGDEPFVAFCGVPCWISIPHASGDEPKYILRSSFTRPVYPTRVGMNRNNALYMREIQGSIPHASGDEPDVDSDGVIKKARIPHASGDEPFCFVARNEYQKRIPHASGDEPRYQQTELNWGK